MVAAFPPAGRKAQPLGAGSPAALTALLCFVREICISGAKMDSQPSKMNSNTVISIDASLPVEETISWYEAAVDSVAAVDPLGPNGVRIRFESPLVPVLRCVHGWSETSVVLNSYAKRLSGAMTNVVFHVWYTGSDTPEHRALIVRMQSSENAFALCSRAHERVVFLIASELDIGPKCILEFGNGRVEEFLPGGTLTPGEIQKPMVARWIAKSLVKFHVEMYENILSHSSSTLREGFGESIADGSGTAHSMIWGRLHAWLDWLKVHETDARIATALNGIDADIVAMKEKSLKRWDTWLGMCHNDLQYGNLVFSTAPSKARQAPQTTDHRIDGIRLIDYEYALVGDIAFDIANHFCEYAADYDAQPTCAVLDWSALPTEPRAMVFCSAYMEELFRLQGKESDGGSSLLSSVIKSCERSSSKLTHIEQAALILCQKSFSLMAISHLKWALWGFIQHRISAIHFDFLSYGFERLEQYHLTKHQLLP